MTAPTKAAARGSLLLLAYLGFVSLGLPDGLLGVGWPSIRDEFGVPTAAVGFLLTASTAGYLTSSVISGFTLSRIGVGWLLAASTACTSAALFGFMGAPWYGLMVGLALLLGFGGGAIDSGLNAYAAGAFGPRHMNWMHAFFGLGVALGPLIMIAGLQGGLSWRWGYGIVAASQAALALAFAWTVSAWQRTPPQRAAAVADGPGVVPSGWNTLALPAVWLSAVAFAVYVAVEMGAGLWAFLLLTEGRGLSAAVAGICVSAYWGSLFVGRLVFGLVAERVGSHRVLTVTLAGMVAGAALVALPAPAAVSVAGLMLIGFAAAPVFPLLTLTTVDRVGVAHTDRAIGLQIGAAGLGGAVIPAGIGLLLGPRGEQVELLGPALLVLTVLLLAFYLISRPRHPVGS